jgi:hypothetical protein
MSLSLNYPGVHNQDELCLDALIPFERRIRHSDLWNLPQQERNARPVEGKRDVPLEEILADSQQVYAQFFEAAQTLSDEDLNDAGHFRDMPPVILSISSVTAGVSWVLARR